ncbi:MAG: NADH-quinone oxidoreductase subunit NuoG [Armatimonadota bacterium]|nr:NADH-quinone oxidoreductase subunit NuoG [Armatimonadota bacterium]
MATDPAVRTVTLTIDGRAVTVPPGTTVYQAARAAGIEIPIFCYHDRMPPLGACRMCLVKVDRMGKLQTSCTLPAADGMVVSTTDPEVVAGQEAILEFLLINHPLDCPICDKGGECPLQDQTFRWGPGRSRFVEAKRDFAKPVSLGPVLALDRERCILCWRCVRFGEIIAGDDALKGFERGFTSEINTPFTLPVESKFIGNTIAICPVGALTSRTYRFRARPWDNEPVPSTCTHCGLGCAVWFDVRGGEIVRTRAREAPAVNDIWLCDLGFFGHDYVASGERLTAPLVRRDGRLTQASWEEALDLVASRLRAARDRAPGRVAFLGGRRLSNEDALVAARLFGEVIGTPHRDHRVDAPPGGASLEVAWGLRAPLEEIARGDVFLLVGCDVTEEYPILWLRMKAAVDRGAALLLLHARRLEVRRHARWERLVRADRLAAETGALADALERGAAGPPPGLEAAVAAIAAGRRVHVVVGRFALDGPGGSAVLAAAVRIAEHSGGVLHVARGKGNDIGAQRFGLLPGAGGWPASEILRRAAAGDLDVLYVAGSDPATAVTDRSAWDAARRGVGFLVVHEAFLSATAEAADVVLPSLVLPEKDGTVTNLEGRTLPLRAAVRGPGAARGDREIFSLIAARLGALFTYGTGDELFEALRAATPGVEAGAVLPVAPVPARLADDVPAGAVAAGAGGGSAELILATIDHLFTQGATTGRCRGITALAGAPHCLIHPDDAARLGVEPGALVELATGHGAVVLQARVTDVTAPGQVLLPRGFDAVSAYALVRWPHAVVAVTVRPLVAAAAGGAP